MAHQNGSEVRSGSGLGPKEWSALGTSLLLGGLAGAALGYPEPGWRWLSLACAGIAASSAGICVLGYRLRAGTAVIGSGAGATAGLEGLLLAWVALRGDSEKVDSLIGTTVMALIFGLAVAALAGMVLGDDSDATRGTT